METRTGAGAEITRRFYRLLGIAGQVVVTYTDTASFSIRYANGVPLTTRPHYQIEDALDEAEQNALKYRAEGERMQSDKKLDIIVCPKCGGEVYAPTISGICSRCRVEVWPDGRTRALPPGPPIAPTPRGPRAYA